MSGNIEKQDIAEHSLLNDIGLLIEKSKQQVFYYLDNTNLTLKYKNLLLNEISNNKVFKLRINLIFVTDKSK